MFPATAWDDADWGGAEARAWTVLGTLRTRQMALAREAAAARRRLDQAQRRVHLMTPAVLAQTEADSLMARWHGGATVIALLFAHPDSDAILQLDARGEYFDVRTGDTWDLFFAGYYKSSESRDFEQATGASPIGDRYARDWYFSARDFDDLRNHVEEACEGRWRYSGGTDLVLTGAWMPEVGDLVVDWASTISGEITDTESGTRTLTLAGVVERLTTDITENTEDPNYGVAEVTDEPAPPHSTVERDFVVNALAGIAAGLGMRVVGS